jgi:RecJ-like exonuclease
MGNPTLGEGPVVLCEGCEGEGRVCCCMQCGEHMLLSEAAVEGAYCEGCRTSLDVSDREAEERALRRVG